MRIPALVLLLPCIYFISSCSILEPEKPEEITTTNLNTEVVIPYAYPDEVEKEPEERRYFREELEAAKDQIREELREVIIEEILPELWTAHNKGKDRDAQKRAFNMAKERTFLGRVEWVKIKDPEFEIQARVDTGAKTSSIHAENIKELQINGEPYVQFETLDNEDKKHTIVRRVVARTKVTSTSGDSTNRYVIRSAIKLGHKTHDVNINLNDRSKLNYRMLIGRNLLIGNYIVDVAESHLLGDKL